MMKRLAFFLVLLAFSGNVFKASAQGTDPAEDVKHSQDILSNLDSLLNLWYVKNSTPAKTKRASNVYGYAPDEVPAFADTAYTNRIAKIESPLPLVYNSSVRAFIDLYAVRKRKQVERMLGLAEHYFPMIEETFDRHNIPIEIKYLCIVESALNTRAVSRVGATGLWQFMYSTGRLYNMDINSFVDQRRDPVRATEAAAVYLKDLHRVFGDWFLAIAAYNCGPGNVNKAIRRSGGKRTFWEIYKYLPVETRGYVPAFIAATYVFHYHQVHNLYPVQVELPSMVDTVHITKEISFDPICAMLKMDKELVRDLNPQYKHDVVPSRGNKPYILVLPSNKAALFPTLTDTIYALYEANRKPIPVDIVDSDPAPPRKKPAADQENETAEATARVRYVVKKGDNISQVADLFDVTVHDIRRWNKLSRGFPVGRRLVLIVPAEKRNDYAAINNMTAQQKKKLAITERIAKADAPEKPAAVKPAAGKPATATAAADKKTLPAANAKPDPKSAPKGEQGGGKEPTGKGTATAQPKPDTKPATAAATPAKPSGVDASKVFIYEVQKGDTLWSIAQRFPGVTVEDIKKANNIADNRSIQVGQKIKISKTNT